MGSGNGTATSFVSGFKTSPVDASFLNGHMIRAMSRSSEKTIASSFPRVSKRELKSSRRRC
jgi:hypothetical protein